jgi:hypothetical protein
MHGVRGVSRARREEETRRRRRKTVKETLLWKKTVTMTKIMSPNERASLGVRELGFESAGSF